MNTFIIVLGQIALCIVAVMYIAALIYVIHDMILILIPAIKCRKVKDCLKDDCRFRRACRHIKLTEWEKIPPWHRQPRETEKKPSIQQRIYHWLKDFFYL